MCFFLHLHHTHLSIYPVSQLFGRQEFKKQGVDFSTHLYVPEVDPVTGLLHHK